MTTRAPAPADQRPTLEPLFARNEQLWLRVWIAMQIVALAVACVPVLENTGGATALLSTPRGVVTGLIVILLAIHHAIGFRYYDWIIRRPWAVAAFVPLGWGMIAALSAAYGMFGVLLLGAILQGFVFLPFSAAIATLALLILVMIVAVVSRQAMTGMGPGSTSLTIARGVTLLSIGITCGTVMLYIHRANRDAAIRARLLRQLDDVQRDLAERAREAGAQDERQRLARDIHDTLAQGFTSVIKHLEAVELSFAAPGADAAEVMRRVQAHLAHAQDVSRTSLAEIRRLVWALRPPQLVDAPLAGAVERIVSHWSETNGIATVCEIGALPPLLPDADVIFLRATQESLSNVARHARASRVTVSMACVDGIVLLSVEDDGQGIADVEAAGAGKMGLAGMRERVRPFGGRVLIESASGAGTNLTVALPLAVVSAAT